MATIEVHILDAFSDKCFCGFSGPWTNNEHWWVQFSYKKDATCEKCKEAVAAKEAQKVLERASS